MLIIYKCLATTGASLRKEKIIKMKLCIMPWMLLVREFNRFKIETEIILFSECWKLSKF